MPNTGTEFSLLKLVTEQRRLADRVLAEAEARDGLERERERHAVVVAVGLVVQRAEGHGRSPTAEVAVDAVVLFLQGAGAGIKVMDELGAPVLVELVEQCAGDEVVAQAEERAV